MAPFPRVGFDLLHKFSPLTVVLHYSGPSSFAQSIRLSLSVCLWVASTKATTFIFLVSCHPAFFQNVQNLLMVSWCQYESYCVASNTFAITLSVLINIITFFLLLFADHYLSTATKGNKQLVNAFRLAAEAWNKKLP